MCVVSLVLLVGLREIRRRLGRIHSVVIVVITIHVLVVLIVNLLQQTLVTLSTVGGTRRCLHVGGIALFFALSSLDGDLGVLVEAHAGQNENLVVHKSTEDK